MFKTASLYLSFLTVFCLAVLPSGAESVNEGKSIVAEKCLACHSVGQGRRVGSDLKGDTKRYKRDWLAKMITAPDKLLAKRDPIATKLLNEYNNIPMPNLGLSSSEVESILLYLESVDGAGTSSSSAATGHSKAAPVKYLEGNALRGEKLFNGSKPFKNKGSSCIACHAMKGSGYLGGGTLGTDLSSLYEKFGEAGLHSTLKSLPFPTMKPIYDDKPLLEQEQSDLVAYFKLVEGEASSKNYLFTIYGFGLFFFLLLLMSFIWKDRLTGVRRKLIEDARKKGFK